MTHFDKWIQPFEETLPPSPKWKRLYIQYHGRFWCLSHSTTGWYFSGLLMKNNGNTYLNVNLSTTRRCSSSKTGRVCIKMILNFRDFVFFLFILKWLFFHMLFWAYVSYFKSLDCKPIFSFLFSRKLRYWENKHRMIITATHNARRSRPQSASNIGEQQPPKNWRNEE